MIARRRWLLSLVVVAVACGSGDRVSAPSGVKNAAVEQAASGFAGGATADSAAAPEMPVATASAPAQGPPGQPPSADTAVPNGPMIIRTGEASIEVDSLEVAIAAVRAVAARVGGFVANSELSAGREQIRSATLQVKIPAARFDDAVNGLSPIGRVETVNVNAQDVGEEYVDVAARAANSRRLEARLVTLLERNTARLTDVLAVERELARVREEIERAEGRMRYLRTRAATSTLSVTVHERAPLVGSSPSSPIGEAFRQAWRNFVGFVAGLIAASGVLIPLGLLVALVAWLVIRWQRARPPREPRPPRPPRE